MAGLANALTQKTRPRTKRGLVSLITQFPPLTKQVDKCAAFYLKSIFASCFFKVRRADA